MLFDLISVKSIPSVLVFEINLRNVRVSKSLQFEQEGETVGLNISRLIYHGDFHYTSCTIGIDGNVGYHDGITTRSRCVNEGE